MTFAEAVSTPALYGALSGNGRLADYATPEALKARIMPEAVKETARRFLVSALDLTGDNPRVVDVHLGQKINV